jgi:hypothetical protein
MAGIDLTGDRRSQLLELLLSQQVQPRKRPIRSGGELAARLGAQLVRQQGIKKLQGEESQAQAELVNALQGRLPERQITLEGFDDVPAENVPVPGRQVGVNAALRPLSPGQQLAGMELQARRRELADPTAFQQKKALQTQSEEAAAEEGALNRGAAQTRVEIQQEAAALRQEKQIEALQTENERDRIQSETESIRQVQSRFELERFKNELDSAADKAGVKLTEQQAKATGWYTSAQAGQAIVQQEIDNGYVPSLNSVSMYAKSIDPDTGAAARVQMRRLIPDRALNFLDAANMIVDPIVRMRTGAAVRTDEFITTFNSVIPIGNKPQEIENKSFFRGAMIDAMGRMSGQGQSLGDAIITGRGIPEQTLGGDAAEEIRSIDAELADINQQLLDTGTK